MVARFTVGSGEMSTDTTTRRGRAGPSGGLPEPSGRDLVLWGLLAAGLALDVVSTGTGLLAGYAEGNPVARAAIAAGGLPGLLGLKLLVAGAGLAVWHALPRPQRAAVPLGLALPWLTAGTLNAVLLL